MSELQRHIDKKKAREAWGAEYRQYMRWTGRALEVPLSVVVGLGLGLVSEHYFAIKPWGSAVGFVFGVAAAVRFAYRLYQDYTRD